MRDGVGGQEQASNLETALANARQLLASRPDLAAEQAYEILRVVPGNGEAMLILGIGLRAIGRTADALGALKPLAAANPKSVQVQFEYGRALAEAGEPEAAVEALRRTLKLNGKHAQAWRVLGDMLSVTGDSEGAEAAYGRHIQASVNDPRLLEAANALCENKLAVAERLLREFLKAHPTDVAAIRMLAETGSRLGRYEDAENLLVRCLELAPGFDAARYNYAVVLSRQNKTAETLAEVEKLLAKDPRNPAYRTLEAAMMARIGEYDRTIESYEAVLREFPTQAKAWMSYGHALKTVGRTEDGIAAYRKSIRHMPNLGEAYWSLANLKTFRFEDRDLDAMRAALAGANLSDDDRLHLDFALGKALEDRGDHAAAFAHYSKANALRRKAMAYEADETSDHVARARALFTPAFFAAREGAGCPAPDPIFILGSDALGFDTARTDPLQPFAGRRHDGAAGHRRAWQSDSAGKKTRGVASAYPEMLADLSPEALRELGEEYLARTPSSAKRSGPSSSTRCRPTGCMSGLIHLILPNARIIDARRHPLACCFSNFKQHFARGQGFTYGLTDLGRYYYDYVMLMDAIDSALPGRVHRVFYEDTVADPERETRRLLAHCGLPFEPECLRFYENSRAVRTASSEQVRQPIFTEGLDQWRHFAPWLGELERALGPVLKNYPGGAAKLAGASGASAANSSLSISKVFCQPALANCLLDSALPESCQLGFTFRGSRRDGD